MFTKMFAPFEVSIFETYGKNFTKLKCICDECGEEFVSGYFSVKDDCRCPKCKSIETYMKHYGAPHNMKSDKGKKRTSKSCRRKIWCEKCFSE